MEEQNKEIKYCTYCGNKNSIYSKFCISCGGSLEQHINQSIEIDDNTTLKENDQEETFGISYFIGLITAILLILFIPFFLAIATMLAFFYITLPNTRKFTNSIIKCLGKLVIYGFLIIIILILILLFKVIIIAF